MPSKRPPINSATTSPIAKTPRTGELGQDGFLTVAGRGQSATGLSRRTGQACDRCKLRKIRCDDTSGGCLPCRQNSTECRTTDRITQRATARGHTEALELDNNALRQHVYNLELQLRNVGVEPKPSAQYLPTRGSPDNGWSPSVIKQWSQEHQKPLKHDPPLTNCPVEELKLRSSEANIFALPTYRNAHKGGKYSGVSLQNTLSSPIKGTLLSVFGMEIDIADFGGIGDSSSPMSYRNLVTCVMRPDPQATRCQNAQLPTDFAEMRTYAEMYLATINPLVPVLHKPALMELTSQLYHEPGFRLTVAETVMLHMMIAMTKFQIFSRNLRSENAKESHEQSLAHCRHALAFVYDLIVSPSLQDLQALTMIVIHLRNFPKPEAAWMIGNTALALAYEAGLHRSQRVWLGEPSKEKCLEAEMRKRVFWSLLTVISGIGRKLGRPMQLRLEDYDVEFPVAYDDNLPLEDCSPGQKCSFRWGIEVFKMGEIFLEMYLSVYLIRVRDYNHEETVRRLEARAEAWRKQLPPEFDINTDIGNEPVNRGPAMNTDYWEAEYQLLLHHPALCTSASGDFVNRNLDICEKAALRVINLGAQLCELNQLDMMNSTSLQMSAIFTLLFIHWERRERITATDLVNLQKELDLCLSIIGHLGEIFGSGNRLETAVRKIVDDGLGIISRHLSQRTDCSAAAVASAALKQSRNESKNLQPRTSFTETGGLAHSPVSAHLLAGMPQSEFRDGDHEGAREYTKLGPNQLEARPAQTKTSAPCESSLDLQRLLPNPQAPGAPPYLYTSYAQAQNSCIFTDSNIGNQAHATHNFEAYPYNTASIDVYQTQSESFGDSEAWRQFAESMQSHYALQPQDYMLTSPTLLSDSAQGGMGQNGPPLTNMNSLPSFCFPGVNVDNRPYPQPWLPVSHDLRERTSR